MQNEGVKTKGGETVELILIRNSSKQRREIIQYSEKKKSTYVTSYKMLIEEKKNLKEEENSNTAGSNILPFQRAIYQGPAGQPRIIGCPAVGCEDVNGQANNG